MARIDQPRGDGKSWQVSVLLDDPGDVQELIDELQKGLAWLEKT